METPPVPVATAVAAAPAKKPRKNAKKPLTHGWIYIITCIVTNLVYIGQTKNKCNLRWNSHKRRARQLMNWYKDAKEGVEYPIKWNRSLLYNAMCEHGIENFTMKPLKPVAFDKLNEEEIKEIEDRGSFGNGYNATKGGGGFITKEKQEEMQAQVTKKVNVRSKQSDVFVDGVSGHDHVKPFNKAGRHGYTITGHPLCKDKSFVISKEYPTANDCLDAAVSFLLDLEVAEEKYVHKWKKDDTLPQGISRHTHGGYTVRLIFGGMRHGRSFVAKTPESDAIAKRNAEVLLTQLLVFRQACMSSLPDEKNEKEL